MHIDFDEISLNIKNRAYPIIGSGSGRLVLDLGNGYVVKKAKNKKGLAQNMAEHRIASMDHSNLFAKIVAVSEDFIYLVMEKAMKIYHISVVWKFFNVKNNRELFRLKEFCDIMTKYNLLFSDLRRSINWGLINDRPVIIDYGFTREVKHRYYSLF